MQRKLVALILILAALAAALTLTTGTTYAASAPVAGPREHTHPRISDRPAPVDAMLTLPHPAMVVSTGAAGPRYPANANANATRTRA
jgi:hypothetical protein